MKNNYHTPNRSNSNQSFRATCSTCGKDCQVPFKPNGSKPIYCDDCFREQGGSRPAIKAKFDRHGKKDESYKGGFSKSEDTNEIKQIKLKLSHIERKLDEILAHYR